MLKGSFDYSKAYISLELSRLFLFKGRTFIFFGFFFGGGDKINPLFCPPPPMRLCFLLQFSYSSSQARMHV